MPSAIGDGMRDFEKLNGENVQEHAESGILVLPVGSVEQHGPHLPLTVDVEIPVRIACAIVERNKGFVAPAFRRAS
jgi:creatinine amidohydrolase/Fe(II)-dependent formamide hydrolase-like protein